MSSKRRVRTIAVAVVSAAALAASGCSIFGSEDGDGDNVDIQLLGFNDFHGNLEPVPESGITEIDEDGNEEFTEAGGVEYFAAHLDEAREGNEHSLTVGAGDLIGGTPFLSAAFDDQPTLDAMDLLGLDVSSVGNHEFDQGVDELQRLIEGGCPEDGCADGEDWGGIDFPFLGANVVEEGTEDPILEPTYVHEFEEGVEVGFIGMTLEATDEVVAAAGIEGIEFLDEIETANRYAAELQDDGVEAIVLLLHEGGYPTEEESETHECDTFGPETAVAGPIVDIGENVDPAVDMMVTGHTHQAYTCTFEDPNGDPRLVASADEYGSVFTDIRMEYDRDTGDIVRDSVEATNVIADRDIEPNSDQTDLIADYTEAVGPIASEVVGYLEEEIPLADTRAEEFALGNMIADAQLDRTQNEDAEIAFMNPGGVRADLAPNEDNEVTYEDIFTVQPFGNYLVTMDLTGEQLVTLLREQYTDREDEPMILLPSDGFTYTLDESQDGEDKIVEDSLQLHGDDIEGDETYRVTVNNFLADGGDAFFVLTEGENAQYGEVDVDAFQEWMEENSSADDLLEAPEEDRITIEE